MELLELKRGDKEVLSLVFTDENGDAYNLTGGTVFFTIKHLHDNLEDDTKALVQASQTVHSSPLTGETEISLTEVQTRSLPVGEYKSDFQFKSVTGAIKSTDQIRIQVVDDVTKRTV